MSDKLTMSRSYFEGAVAALRDQVRRLQSLAQALVEIAEQIEANARQFDALVDKAFEVQDD